VVILDIYI